MLSINIEFFFKASVVATLKMRSIPDCKVPVPLGIIVATQNQNLGHRII